MKPSPTAGLATDWVLLKQVNSSPLFLAIALSIYYWRPEFFCMFSSTSSNYNCPASIATWTMSSWRMKQTIKTKLSNKVIANKEETWRKWDPYTEDGVDHQISSKWVLRLFWLCEAWFDLVRNKYGLEVLNVIRSVFLNTVKSMN